MDNITTATAVDPFDDTVNTMMEALKAPFKPEDVDFRAIQWNRECTSALAFAYIDSRAVMDRLDEVFGMNWSLETTFVESKETPGQVNVQAEISICPTGSIGHIRRSGFGSGSVLVRDGGSVTNDPIKSAESDAIKRAGMAFGIGRYLYSLPHIWIAWDGDKSYGNFAENPRDIFFNSDGTTKDSAIASDSKRRMSPTPPRRESVTPSRSAPTTRGGGTSNNRNIPSDALISYLREIGQDDIIDSTLDATCNNIVNQLCGTPAPSAAQIKYVVNLCEQTGMPFPDFAIVDRREANNLIKAMQGT